MALSFAHSDRRDSLESACARFGEPYTKTATAHGQITADYVTYCREDVAATAQLCQDTYREHVRHPIDLPANNALSPATIGRAYWKAMGIIPFADRDGWIGDDVNGWGMAAFYGGRAECHIRHVAVPVVYCDFASMYPTCNTLMHTWNLITANYLSLDNVTATVRDLVNDPNLAERCFDPTLWPLLHALVEIEPNGAVLPVRARYDPASTTWSTGLNPLNTSRRHWYALGDVLAAAILGPAPTIVQAWRLVPTEQLPNLKATKLYGTIPYHPANGDFFRAVVEHRYRTRNDRSVPGADRERIGQFLKVVGNSTGFGILAQYDRREPTDDVDVTVHTDGQPFHLRTDRYDQAADYCAPPLAAAVTAAARLMLTLLEHETIARGGTYAFCDTDSMAIVATRKPRTITIGNQTSRTLSWADDDRIVERFAALNPYNPDLVPGSILKIEDENYDPATRKRRQLDCYAISAKRYQLTDHGRNVKASQHGLGHLLNPATGCDDDWTVTAWDWIQGTGTEPDWLDLPAVSRITVTGPEVLRWFEPINRNRAFRDRVQPGNFLLVAHPDPLTPNHHQPIAPYRPDPADWLAAGWIDRTTGQPIHIDPLPVDGTQRLGTCRVLTYRDILTRYRNHPETKSLGPDHQPIRRDTTGILQRRPVTPIEPITYIGKEAHNLHQQTNGFTPDTDIVPYTPDPLAHWHHLVTPVLATIGTATIAAVTGVNQRTIQRAIAGHNTPHPHQRAALTDYAVTHCRKMLGTRTGTDHTVLAQYLRLQNTSS